MKTTVAGVHGDPGNGCKLCVKPALCPSGRHYAHRCEERCLPAPDAPRCAFDHGGIGPRCIVAVATPGSSEHESPHLFKCAGAACPGLPWPASVMSHPYTCVAS